MLVIGIYSCRKDTSQNKNPGMIQLVNLKIGTSVLNINTTITNVPVDQPIQFLFSTAVDTNSIKMAEGVSMSEVKLFVEVKA